MNISRCNSMIAAVLCWLIMSVTFAAGQNEAVFDIEIDDQPLPVALKTLAEQVGLQLMFPTDALNGSNRVSISGEYTLKQALNILLVDTSLEYSFDKHKNLAIRPVGKSLTEASEIIPAEYNHQTSRQTKSLQNKELILAQAETATASQERGASGQAQSRTLLEEVVVTAQKREQSLNDIGISINAFTGREIRENRIERMSDLGAYVPNVKMSDARPGGNPKVVYGGLV